MKVADRKLTNFVMNDKCAAGTGRFLEVIADVLGVALLQLWICPITQISY